MATRSVLERSRSALHLRLLAAQRRLATKQYGAVIVIGGNDRLAASELANQLTEWFDARTVRVCAPDATSAAGRPFLWPYWQDVPAKGRITIVVGDWLTRTAVEAAHDELNGERLRSRLKSIRTFEEMLAADGTSVVKVWLETPDKSLRKRLREAEDTDAEGWVVTEEDLLLAKRAASLLPEISAPKAAARTSPGRSSSAEPRRSCVISTPAWPSPPSSTKPRVVAPPPRPRSRARVRAACSKAPPPTRPSTRKATASRWPSSRSASAA